MSQHHEEPPERDCIVRVRQVVAQTGLPRSPLLYLVKKLEFPSPLRLSDRSIGFLQSEVDHWIASRPRTEVSPK
jgi:prophage regulatory protein